MDIRWTINFKKVTIILLLSCLLILISTVAIASSTSQPWSATYGGPNDDGFNSVIQTLDGGYAAVGYTSSFGNGTSGNGTFYNDTSNVILVKTDINGKVQWNKTYGGSLLDVGYGIVQTTDGGYAIAGYETSFTNGTMNVYLIRTDADGNMLWNKTFGNGVQDGAYSIAKTSDSGFILTGFTYLKSKGGWDAYLIKTDAKGNMLWNRTYGGTDKDLGHYVEQTSDGGYIITGSTKSFGIRGGDRFDQGTENLWLIKTDANGTEQWNKTFGGKDYDDGFYVNQQSDGSYIVTGTTKSFNANGTMRNFSINNTARAYLIKTDANGNELWNLTYGENTDMATYSMIIAPDGYVIAGTTYTNATGWDVFALKTDLNGSGEWAYTYGGLQDDYGYSICPSDNGYVIAGSTNSFGNGGLDGYLVKIAENGSGPTSLKIWPTTTPENNSGNASSTTNLILVPIVIACVAIAALVIWKWLLRK